MKVMEYICNRYQIIPCFFLSVKRNFKKYHKKANFRWFSPVVEYYLDASPIMRYVLGNAPAGLLPICNEELL
jgi:hypothetical protein